MKAKHLQKTVSLFLTALLFSLADFTFARGLATPQYTQQVTQFYGLSTTKNFYLLNIMGYQQTEDYTCGPAAVMSLLHYYGKLSNQEMNKSTELKIAAEMGTTPEKGTSQQQIATWLNQHGFKAEIKNNGTPSILAEHIKKGHPILVNWIDWGGHWVVSAGYKMAEMNPNQKIDILFFADSAVSTDSIKYMNGLSFINADRFASMWFNSTQQKNLYIVATPLTEL